MEAQQKIGVRVLGKRLVQAKKSELLFEKNGRTVNGFSRVSENSSAPYYKLFIKYFNLKIFN